LDNSTAAADKIVANGVTINGANFALSDLGRGKFSFGATLIIIDNTSASLINGVFSRLPDNSVFTDNGNTYQVSYEGGTGNDLTLTVVPEPSTWVMLGVGLAMLAALMGLGGHVGVRPQAALLSYSFRSASVNGMLCSTFPVESRMRISPERKQARASA
jgi:hypothetical protein